MVIAAPIFQIMAMALRRDPKKRSHPLKTENASVLAQDCGGDLNLEGGAT